MSALVSVVLPTYNRADLISAALDSVFGQDYRPIELIVIDDGSTDHTEAVLKEWRKRQSSSADFSMHYMKQTNQGGNAARNAGILNSSGEFIAFLDSDDVWHPTKTSKQIDVFMSDSECGGVYCGVQQVEKATGRITEPVIRPYPQGRILEKMLVRDVTAQTSAFILKKEVFDVVGLFDVELPARQDWDMWIRLASKYSIKCVQEPLVDYYTHEGIRTASDPNKEIKAYQVILKKYAHLRANGSLCCRLAARAAYYRRMGRVYFRNQISYRKAFLYATKAILIWPFDFDSYAALAGMLLPQNFRKGLRFIWNQLFGKTVFAIRSH